MCGYRPRHYRLLVMVNDQHRTRSNVRINRKAVVVAIGNQHKLPGRHTYQYDNRASAINRRGISEYKVVVVAPDVM